MSIAELCRDFTRITSASSGEDELRASLCRFIHSSAIKLPTFFFSPVLAHPCLLASYVLLAQKIKVFWFHKEEGMFMLGEIQIISTSALPGFLGKIY